MRHSWHNEAQLGVIGAVVAVTVVVVPVIVIVTVVVPVIVVVVPVFVAVVAVTVVVVPVIVVVVSRTQRKKMGEKEKNQCQKEISTATVRDSGGRPPAHAHIPAMPPP
jgi:Flp pilus assembly protein TadB